MHKEKCIEVFTEALQPKIKNNLNSQKIRGGLSKMSYVFIMVAFCPKKHMECYVSIQNNEIDPHLVTQRSLQYIMQVKKIII